MVPGLDPALLERVVARFRELEPTAIAVLIFGSYARGTAHEDSDLDLRAITTGEPLVAYRTWFHERPGSKPLHVSAGAKSLKAWLAARKEPDWWTFSFPVARTMRYAWSTEEARRELGEDPSHLLPPGEPELEDFVEYLGKVKRCAGRGDSLGARLFAQGVGLLAPGLLRPLNDEVIVHDRREALAAALDLRVAPEHYRDDLAVCLGLVEAGDRTVHDAALRLGLEMLAFLRERKPDVDPQPDIAQYVADGTLERHLGFTD